MSNIKTQDKEDISYIFNDAYGTSRSETDWKWQYDHNPQGKSIRYIFEEDEELIGHVGIIPMDINCSGKIVKSGLVLDSVVLKDHRKKGHFKSLLLESMEEAKKNGYEFLTSYPTMDAIGTLVDEQVDMDDITDIPFFINILKMDNFLKGVLKIGFLAKLLAIPAILINKVLYSEKKVHFKETYDIREVEEFDENYDLLWENLEDKQVMTKRSSEFLNWRIKNHPRIDYKSFAIFLGEDLVGYIVLKIEERKVRRNATLRVGTIVDLIGLNEEIIKALYLKSKTYFKSEGVDFIVLWASPNMKYRRVFVDLGFSKTRSGLPLFVKGFGDEEFNQFIKDEKNWYLMPIESDIYWSGKEDKNESTTFNKWWRYWRG